MAQTGVASARTAGHAARLAVHAASGLAWSAGPTDAARCPRAAEGAVRAALAQLHSPPLWHQGAGTTAEEEGAQQQESAPRTRKRRKRRRPTCGPQQPVVGKEAAADCMEVDPPTPPGEQQELQLEQESAKEPATAKAGEEEPNGAHRREEEVRKYLAFSEAGGFLASRLRETSSPSKQLTALSELVRRYNQELRKPFGTADEEVQHDTYTAALQLHTKLLAEERKRAATVDVPFSLLQAGRSADSSAGKGESSSKLL